MTLDRQRLKIDLVTALVVTGFVAVLIAWEWPTYRRPDGFYRPRLQLYALVMALAVGPQLFQAALTQLILRRFCLPIEGRVVVIAAGWVLGLMACVSVLSGGWDGNVAFLGGVFIVPLLVATRLTVRAVATALGRRRERAASRQGAAPLIRVVDPEGKS